MKYNGPNYKACQLSYFFKLENTDTSSLKWKCKEQSF